MRSLLLFALSVVFSAHTWAVQAEALVAAPRA